MNRSRLATRIGSVAAAAGLFLQYPAYPATVAESVFQGPAWVHVPSDELRASYDTLLAVSDLHGTLARTRKLFVSAGIVVPDSSGKHRWAGSAASGRRTLLVVLGDSIDKGEDSVGVLLYLKDLQKQAAQAGGKVVLLLGNHEADFLADKLSSREKAELLESAESHAGEIGGLRAGERVRYSELLNSEIGRHVSSQALGAVIGGWLFAHSGYLDVDKNAAKVEKYVRKMGKAYSEKRFDKLTDEAGDRLGTILKAHDWFRTKLRSNDKRLKLAGIFGLVMGHDPDALDARGKIAIHRRVPVVKVDAGVNPEADDSSGYVMRCRVSNVLPRGATALKMLDQSGRPLCAQTGVSGVNEPITVSAAGE